jgi:diketogulonate reductase-like aldo/keto reductase
VNTTISTDAITLPALGFGTWQLEGDDARHGVEAALDAGYRHIDTAQIYGNEAEVGQGLAASPVARDEVFLTTKIWRDAAAATDVERTTTESLTRLGVDHVDLLLLHWPSDAIAPLEATLEAMTSVRERGLARHIGVSNFPAALYARACELAPVVNNQVEHHPYLSVDAIREVAARTDGFVTAYSPIAQGRVLDDETLTSIGEDHGVTAVQVTLRWHLQRGISAIPRSRSAERIRANADVFGFALTDTEVARIDALARGERLIDPPFAATWDAA